MIILNIFGTDNLFQYSAYLAICMWNVTFNSINFVMLELILNIINDSSGFNLSWLHR